MHSKRGIAVLIMLLLMVSLALAQGPRGRGGRRGGDRFGPGGSGGPGGGGMSAAMLLRMPEVRKELKVSEDQGRDIDELLESASDRGRDNRDDFQDLDEEERQQRLDEIRKKAAEANKATDEKLAKILDEKQSERLTQLRLQREGFNALAQPDFAKQLGVSEEQQDKIRKAQEKLRPQGGARPEFQDMSDEERQEFFAKMQKDREDAEKEMTAVLTADQQAKWKQLKGEEFEFPRGGGFGGFGPGGRGPGERGIGGGGPGGRGFGGRGFGGRGGGGEKKRPARSSEF
jgi:hypothetical protein